MLHAGAGETIAGFVLVQPPGNRLPVAIRVRFADTLYILPAVH